MIEWMRRHLIATCLLLVVVVSVAWSIPIVIALKRSTDAAHRADQATDCVQSVVNQVIVRSDIVGEAAKKRDDALHDMLSFALSNPAEARNIFNNRYLPAKKEFDKAREDNPIPVSPELACPQ